MSNSTQTWHIIGVCNEFDEGTLQRSQSIEIWKLLHQEHISIKAVWIHFTAFNFSSWSYWSNLQIYRSWLSKSTWNVQDCAFLSSLFHQSFRCLFSRIILSLSQLSFLWIHSHISRICLWQCSNLQLPNGILSPWECKKDMPQQWSVGWYCSNML